MVIKNRTIFITGGSDGIGLALAEALVSDNTVIICGRSEEKLALAKSKYPKLHTLMADITKSVDRDRLIHTLITHHPSLDILINNAGAKTETLWFGNHIDALNRDMALNFEAPVVLCEKLLPHFEKQSNAVILNITSGLVYLPKASQAFYCCAKSALQSYTQSLYWVIKSKKLNITVKAVVVPLVNTTFHTEVINNGITAADAAHRIIKSIQSSRCVKNIGKSHLARWLSFLFHNGGMYLVNKSKNEFSKEKEHHVI